MFKSLDRVQLSTLVGFAAFGGVAASGMGYMVATQKQRTLRAQAYFRRGLDVLDLNKRATQLIGKPIGLKYVDLNRDDIYIEKDKVRIFVPLAGQRLEGDLQIKAHRSPVTDAWILEQIYFEAKSGKPEEWIGKRFIIYNGDPEPAADGTVQAVVTSEHFNPDTHQTPASE